VIEDRKGDWLYTYTGRQFYPIDPRPEDVDLVDIAQALSQLCRFTGHTKRFYSVAEHCCHIHDAAPEEYRAWGLMHDAAEAYVNDMSRPLKRGCGQVGEIYREVEYGIMCAIAEKFRLEIFGDREFDAAPANVQFLDDRMLVTEADQVFLLPAHWTKSRPWVNTPRLPVEIGFWDPSTARSCFMKRAEELRLT